MNTLQIIYIIGALAIGFLMGMILELCLDAQTIRELQDDNRRLRLLSSQLQKEKKIEYLEITDNTVSAENLPSYSKDW